MIRKNVAGAERVLLFVTKIVFRLRRTASVFYIRRSMKKTASAATWRFRKRDAPILGGAFFRQAEKVFEKDGQIRYREKIVRRYKTERKGNADA